MTKITFGPALPWSFSEFFLISPEQTVKLIRLTNSESELNLYIFHNFPKTLDRSITFNNVILKNTQTEPQKYIILFNETNNI